MREFLQFLEMLGVSVGMLICREVLAFVTRFKKIPKHVRLQTKLEKQQAKLEKLNKGATNNESK